METVLDLLLIRFGIIVGVVVLAALTLFTVAVALRRRGRGDALRRHADRARRYAAPVVADAARDIARGRRVGLGGAAARAAGRYLADTRGRDGDRR
ncbi:hypothetical protein Athai_58310 [Actinocatenispora thailandica]|uniref:Uncharacterized protein n=1 Tax=Actinocatenispora thailandica TaxID=227318 RepID=A0A7R7HZJ8_9ACTN|nr:hypothetical protein [Actinocatenispora thailandica]BCJ38328.1 hypothetical protein Athai_58310 [Actinocatenispora thailandica]